VSFISGLAFAAAAIAAFSTQPPGSALPDGWRELRLAHVRPSEIALVGDEGATVLRVHSSASAGTAAYALHEAPAGSELAWRWKIDHVIDKADLYRKAGDDFAARVYVFFDVPMESMSWVQRIKLGIARLIYGGDVPGASICYVWDNRHPPGTSAWNPYSDRVRTVVVESGNERAGRWLDERRDVAADFRAAFGERVAARITGVAAGNDTDQTGESATAWFGDLRFEAPR
jgi:hypothetical protein